MITLSIMSAWSLAVAAPGVATLEVGVHRAAGDLASVVAEGADGPCERLESTIQCPASGSVTFRWEGSDAFSLQGVDKVYPGEKGVAYVLASETSCASSRDTLQAEWITAEQVLEMFVQIGDQVPPVPCLGMIDDLAHLTRHPKRDVRRAAVDALFPLMRDTASDPFWLHAPDIVPAGILLGLTQDSDRGVRRRTALLLREGQPGELDMERQVALRILATDPITPVRRPAIAALPRAVQLDFMPGELAWHEALGRVPLRAGAGRAAVGALARMSKLVEVSETVVPETALDLAMRYHPERAWVFWSAWREHIPFHSGRAERLLLYTVGLNEPLLTYWSSRFPNELRQVVDEWYRKRGMTERFKLAQRFLTDVEDAELREALKLGPRPN